MAKVDGDDHDLYHQFNGINSLKFVVVALSNGLAIACRAIKPFDERRVEVKRMYTSPEFRGRGVAKAVLKELEDWAKELGCDVCVLETGINQQEAIMLYDKIGYKKIANYR